MNRTPIYLLIFSAMCLIIALQTNSLYKTKEQLRKSREIVNQLEDTVRFQDLELLKTELTFITTALRLRVCEETNVTETE